MPTHRNPQHLDNDAFRHRLSALPAGPQRDALRQGLRGIERESLRVTPEGKLAMTPHPRAFGSALTHPLITTDYSEALLELITDARTDVADTLEQLDTLHRFVYAKLGDELLWNDSMPGELPPDDEIPIGWYGTSNIGMLKHVYRRGLALRYGRTMQCIAGIHYNYSLHEDVWRAWQTLDQGNHAVGRRFPVGALPRADPQLPPHELAADVPVRRIAGARRGLRARQAPHARNLRRRHALSAARHQPAHERSRLHEQSGAVGAACRATTTSTPISTCSRRP